MNKVFFCGIICLGLFQFSAKAQRPTSSGKPKPLAVNQTIATPAAGDAQNVFPESGFAGIGILTPGAPMEIKKGIGNTRSKNILLKLSNEWASGGQNEPSIMFSNGDLTNPKNMSYWTIGARVSGDDILKTPQTFKISHKAGNDAIEKEFFSIDSYEGRVKIGDVNTQVDGYKLYVEQGILTEKVKVAIKNSKDWYDHVFHKNYSLMPLPQLEQYIQKNKHLPGIQTTEEVMKDGLDLGKMNALLLKKVEELTLYNIQQQKEINAIKKLLKKRTKQ
jgi:trimeric autotransporter adhesin